MPTIEYRKLFRARITLEIDFETLREPVHSGSFYSTDLSPSGASVVGRQKFELGAELKIKIHLKSGEPSVPALVKVIWQKQCPFIPDSQRVYFACGLRFLEMSPEDAIKTSDFIYDVVKTYNELEEKEIIQKLESR